MMKKSGTRCSGALTVVAASAEALIAPQLHHVAIEVIAQRGDLRREARAQLCHQPLVHRQRLSELGAALDRDRLVAQPAWCEHLDRTLRAARPPAAPAG